MAILSGGVPGGLALPGGVGARTLVARPDPVPLIPGETALVVVDMQNAYASPGGYLDLAGFDISGAPAVIAANQRAIAAARALGVLVVYLQNGWDREKVEAGGPQSPNWYKSNALKLMRQNPDYDGKLITKGTWDYAIVDELTPQPGDVVVAKPRYSGFWGTNLDEILRARRIRTLLFTGVATNVCVESTLRDAFGLEYFPVMLADATGHAGPPELQAATMFNVETFFGWVSSVAALEALTNERA